MATSHVIELNAVRSSPASRTGGPGGAPSRNRFVAFFATLADIVRESRELELRMQGNGRYRRLGES